MANPLARVVMNNIAKKSNIGASNSGGIHSKSNLSQNEEQSLANLINNKSNNNHKKSFEKISYTNQIEKLSLSDLASRGMNTKSEKTDTYKNNSMMTLNDLAKSFKGASSKEDNTAPVDKRETNELSRYIKSTTINNLEAYIPKVSLNSIGKKSSLK